jgi:hypothetical protein
MTVRASGSVRAATGAVRAPGLSMGWRGSRSTLLGRGGGCWSGLEAACDGDDQQNDQHDNQDGYDVHDVVLPWDVR